MKVIKLSRWKQSESKDKKVRIALVLKESSFLVYTWCEEKKKEEIIAPLEFKLESQAQKEFQKRCEAFSLSAAKFLWPKKYLIKVENIDHEHEAIYEAIHDLADIADKVKPLTELSKTFKHFTQILKEHMAHEEKLMAKYSYDALSEHTEIHQGFLTTLKEKLALALQEENGGLKTFVQHVWEAYKEHVSTHDANYSKFINALDEVSINESYELEELQEAA